MSLVRTSMLQDHPLYFISLGLQLERVGQTARIVDVHHHAFLSSVESRDGAEAVVEISPLALAACVPAMGMRPS